ncbi:MAG: thioredoxin family protein [Aureispira sp.]|nr:thioredoxin family protein [Aureispira sp.]
MKKIFKTISFFGLLTLLVSSCGDQQTTGANTASVDNEPKTNTAPTKENEEKMPKGYQVGDIATDFNLKNVDDQMVSLGSYGEAKGFIVIFTCNHCPYSIAYEDRIIELDKKYKALGYPVIAINPNDPEVAPDDDFEGMKVRASEKGFTFPYLFDEEQKVYPAYGATKTPHTYILQKTEEGLKVAYIGAIDDSKEAEDVSKPYLNNALDALLKGEAPNPDYTKAFGCSIKAKKI